MSLQEECDEIQQAVTNNNVTVLWELIIKGVDINNAEVYDRDGVSENDKTTIHSCNKTCECRVLPTPG